MAFPLLRPSSAQPWEPPQPRPTGHQALDAAAAAPQPCTTAGSRAPPAAQARTPPKPICEGQAPGGTGSAAIGAGSAEDGAGHQPTRHHRQEERREKGKVVEEGELQGKGGEVPAAALIAAEWTSIGELRRRRGGGEEGGGARGEGAAPPESPLGATRGRVQNSQFDGPVGGWGSNDYFTLDLFG